MIFFIMCVHVFPFILKKGDGGSKPNPKTQKLRLTCNQKQFCLALLEDKISSRYAGYLPLKTKKFEN